MSQSSIDTEFSRQQYLAELEAKIATAEAQLKKLKETTNTEKFLSAINKACQMGRTACANPRHFTVCSWSRADNHCSCSLKSKQTEHARPHKFILDDMVPFEVAKCKCERDALANGQRYNYPGMPAVRWVALGADHVGVDSKNSTKRVMPLAYSLTPQQLKTLSERFPGWYFIPGSILCHDHPVAHTCAKMAAFYVMNEALPKGRADAPHTVVDINGTPAPNLSRMARDNTIKIHTVCKRHTPKDELRRAMRWGPKFDDDGNVRWHDLWDREIGADHPNCTLPAAEFQNVDSITMMHVLYYYTPEDIDKLLSRAGRDTVIYATLHKHEGDSGVLNGGEQRWERIVDSGGRYMIKQTNTVGGESYTHMPTDWIFKQNSVYTSRSHGLTWDVNLICPDTFLVRMKRFERGSIGVHRHVVRDGEAYCPRCDHCESLQPVRPGLDERANQAVPNSAEWLRRYGTVVYSVAGETKEPAIREVFHGVLGHLRNKMVGRPRIVEEYQNLLSLARTRVNRIQSEAGVLIDPNEFKDLVDAAFWMDAEAHVAADVKAWDAMQRLTTQSAMVYKYGGNAATKSVLHAALDMASASNLKTAANIGASHIRKHAH